MLNVLAAKKPRSGNNAWKPPNHNAVLMTSTGRTRVTVNPFPIETAKASMATDTEISSISIIAGT